VPEGLQAILHQLLPGDLLLPWSDDQLRCVDKIEEVILRGGLFALAMPRGSGKTALCQTAVVWAQAYGHKRYIYFLGDDQESAEDSLASIKTEWEANLRLAEDFPEISLPLIKADGMSVRFHGQTCYGERVQCHWGSDKIVLPSIQFPGCPPGWEAWLKPLRVEGKYASENAGIVTRTKGITGGIRGAIFKHPLTGELLRPDLFIADDIQTDKVADSPSQINKITRYLESAVQGLAGPGEVISGLMPCTVIQEGDVSDTFLDRQLKPRWKGERCAMVIRWPIGITDTEITEDTEAGRLWNEYARLRLTGLQQDGDHSRQRNSTTAPRGNGRWFCLLMGGAIQQNPSLGKNVEISAQQHAMNLRLDNPGTFASEYQNRPLVKMTTNSDVVSPEQIAKRTSAIKRLEIPNWCEIITTFVDIQDEVLFHATLACGTDYTGVITDYGTYPEFAGHGFFTKAQTESWAQLSRQYFEVNPNEAHLAEHQGRRIKAPFESKIHFALEQLTQRLLAGSSCVTMARGDDNVSPGHRRQLGQDHGPG
jgi:hypothetical protein